MDNVSKDESKWMREKRDRHTDTITFPHLILLSDTMSTILSLEILMGVPIRVKDDYGIGRLQVKAEATSTCGQQEEEVLAGGVEESQEFTTIFRLGHTCE